MTRLVQSVRRSTLPGRFERLLPAARPRRAAWLADAAPDGHRALRGRGLPDDARRGVEVHQRRADRRPAFRARRTMADSGLDAGSGAALGRRAGGYRLVFVNGAYAPQLSSVGALPAGVRVSQSAVDRWPRTRRPWSRISAGSPTRSAARSRR